MIEVKKMFTNTMLLPCALIQLYFSATKETLFFSFTTLNMGAVGTLLGHCWDTVGTLLEHCWDIYMDSSTENPQHSM